MVCANRKLTAAVLLASYIAATIGAWSHGRHDCRELAWVDDSSARHVCPHHAVAADADPWAHGGCDNSFQLPRESLLVLGSLHDPHAHHVDECLICQFLAIQKVIEFSNGVIPAATILAQRLISFEDKLLVAERFGMPESRAPPQTC